MATFVGPSVSLLVVATAQGRQVPWLICGALWHFQPTLGGNGPCLFQRSLLAWSDRQQSPLVTQRSPESAGKLCSRTYPFLLPAVVDETQVAPAGTPLRVRLMSLFCKSVAAANVFPGALEVQATPASCNGLRLCMPH